MSKFYNKFHEILPSRDYKHEEISKGSHIYKENTVQEPGGSLRWKKCPGPTKTSKLLS